MAFASFLALSAAMPSASSSSLDLAPSSMSLYLPQARRRCRLVGSAARYLERRLRVGGKK